MTKNKATFLMVLGFLCMGAVFGTAQAQDLTFTPDGAAGNDDGGLSVLASPYGSEGDSDGQPDGPKLGAKYTPQWTKDFTVAADYYKLLGKAPDFAQWAQNSDQFKALGSNPFTQKQVKENLVKQYTAMFNNVSVADNIIIRMRVEMSEYSKLNQGFIVLRGFSNDAYFRYHFGGQDFAVVPQKLGEEENTWISVPQHYIADTIAKTLAASNYMMNIALFIKPVYADAASGPVQLDENGSYYLLSGTVSNIMILDPAGTKVLWEKNSKQYTEDQKNDLLNLKQ